MKIPRRLPIILIALAVLSTIALGIVAFFKANLDTKIPEIVDAVKQSPSQDKVPVRNIQDEPAAYEENMKKGDIYFAKGHASLAIQAYTLGQQIFPGKHEPYVKIGSVYLENENYEKAIKNFMSALTIDAKNEKAIIGLTSIYFIQEKHEEAKKLLESYKNAPTVIGLQHAYFELIQSNFEAAKAQFSAIAENTTDATVKKIAERFVQTFTQYDLSRDAPKTYLNTLLARNLNEQKQFIPAIVLLDSALEEKKDYRDAWILLGYAYLNSQKPFDAVAALDEALRLDPEKAETRYLLGLAHFHAGNIKEAINNLEIARQNQFQPKEEVLQKLGDMYLADENYELAAQTYQKLAELQPDNVQLFVKPIWLNIEHTNDLERAEILAKQAANAHPNSAMSKNLLGWVQLKKKNYQDARTLFEEALVIDPNLDAAHLNLGMWYEAQNMQEEARASYKKAYELGNGNAVSNMAAQRFNALIPTPAE